MPPSNRMGSRYTDHYSEMGSSYGDDTNAYLQQGYDAIDSMDMYVPPAETGSKQSTTSSTNALNQARKRKANAETKEIKEKTPGVIADTEVKTGTVQARINQEKNTATHGAAEASIEQTNANRAILNSHIQNVYHTATSISPSSAGYGKAVLNALERGQAELKKHNIAFDLNGLFLSNGVIEDSHEAHSLVRGLRDHYDLEKSEHDRFFSEYYAEGENWREVDAREEEDLANLKDRLVALIQKDSMFAQQIDRGKGGSKKIVDIVPGNEIDPRLRADSLYVELEITREDGSTYRSVLTDGRGTEEDGDNTLKAIPLRSIVGHFLGKEKILQGVEPAREMLFKAGLKEFNSIHDPDSRKSDLELRKLHIEQGFTDYNREVAVIHDELNAVKEMVATEKSMVPPEKHEVHQKLNDLLVDAQEKFDLQMAELERSREIGESIADDLRNSGAAQGPGSWEMGAERFTPPALNAIGLPVEEKNYEVEPYVRPDDAPNPVSQNVMNSVAKANGRPIQDKAVAPAGKAVPPAVIQQTGLPAYSSIDEDGVLQLSTREDPNWAGLGENWDKYNGLQLSSLNESAQRHVMALASKVLNGEQVEQVVGGRSVVPMQATPEYLAKFIDLSGMVGDRSVGASLIRQAMEVMSPQSQGYRVPHIGRQQIANTAQPQSTSKPANTADALEQLQDRYFESSMAALDTVNQNDLKTMTVSQLKQSLAVLEEMQRAPKNNPELNKRINKRLSARRAGRLIGESIRKIKRELKGRR